MRLLVLAYHFPPIGGAGVQRTLKFVRYLPDYGYQPVVVTGPGPSSFMPQDAALAAEVGAGVEVVRASGPEPADGGRWRARAERWLRAPSPFHSWWVASTIVAGRGVASDVDLIYASMPPFDSAEVAARLSRESGVPWVADLRDAWGVDEISIYPSALHRALEGRRMRRLLASAAAIVMNTDEAARRVRERFPELARRPLVTIHNGYDAPDFAGLAPPRDPETFRIVHTGLFLSELGARHRAARARALLKGARPGLDLLTRSPLFLYEALGRFARAEPGLAERVELHLAGALGHSDREAAHACPVRVLMPGYLSHADSVALARSADLLFLPMHTPPPGMASSSMPGKTFEYLASGRPILAAVPHGDARDILLEAGGALLAWPDDVSAMAAHVGAEVRRWQSAEPTPAPRPEVVRRFERRVLTGKLAQVLDRALADMPTKSRVERGV